LDKAIEFGVLTVGAISLATIFGTFLARMITFEMGQLEKTFVRVACDLCKVNGINLTKQMNLKKDFLYLFMNNTNNQSLNINHQFINLIMMQ
jgi:K+-transporting ATPase ATPase A chain